MRQSKFEIISGFFIISLIQKQLIISENEADCNSRYAIMIDTNLFQNQTHLKFNALFIIRKTFNPIFRFCFTDLNSFQIMCPFKIVSSIISSSQFIST